MALSPIQMLIKFFSNAVGGFFILVLWSIVSGISYCYYYVLEYKYADSPFWFTVFLLSGLYCAFLILFHHMCCVFISPGSPTEKFTEVEDVTYEYRKLCRKCQIFRPPRAHHCSVCQKCILKYDHHCPWINNCVGHYNHIHFVLFLFFIVVTSAIYAWVSVPPAYSVFTDRQSDAYRHGPRSSIILCGMITGIMGGFMALFFLWHLYLVFENQTTLENIKSKGANKYNHGPWKNLKFFLNMKFLGHVYQLFTPTVKKPAGDGYFELEEEEEEVTLGSRV